MYFIIVTIVSMTMSSVSKAQIVEGNSFKINPNPIKTSWINVDFKDATMNGYATIYDMVGQQLLPYKPFNGGTFQMDLWNYSTGRPIERGIYTIIVWTTGNKKIRLTGRLVKQ